MTPNTYWLIPCNTSLYDPFGAFENLSTIDWRQSCKLEIGDIVFIYCTRPYSKIMFMGKVLLTDITYIPLNKEFCYLSVILDAFTMQVLAYQLSESLEVDFVLETVNQLIRYHGQTLDSDTMIHSDQGCHYTSLRFRELIEDNKLRQSMSRRGNCWDNAPQESFFGHMKDELKIQSVEWTSFEEVSVAIDEWMDYYNNDRYQMGLQKMSPNEYYKYITQGIYPASMPRMEERSKKFPPCP